LGVNSLHLRREVRVASRVEVVGDRSEKDCSETDRSETVGDRSAKSLPVAGVTDSPPRLIKKH
jgi:hypothetical protein